MTLYVALVTGGLIVFGAGIAESETPAQRAESPATQEIAALQRECEAGKTSVCKTLGDVYRLGASVSIDMARAASFYKRACDGRDSEGCVALALLYANGTGVPKDRARAAALSDQSACQQGEPSGCHSLAIAFRDGVGVENDVYRAEEFFRKACDRGLEAGCKALAEVAFEIARRVREGERRHPSEPQEVCVRHILVKVESEPVGDAEAQARSRAQAVLTSLKAGTDFGELARKLSEDAGSASGGGDIGCFPRRRMTPEFDDVAFALQVGETSGLVRTAFGFHVIQRTPGGAGVAESETPAQREARFLATPETAAFRKDCDAGNLAACKTLGDTYSWGLGSGDMARAASLYKQACDGPDSNGCVALASLYTKGTGVPKDPTRALTLLHRAACQEGDSSACYNRGIALRDGVRVESDVYRAEELFRKACDRGLEAGCQALGELVFEIARRVRESAERRQPSEPPEVCARHILVKLESPARAGQGEGEARNLAEGIHFSLKVLGSANDFAELARKFSEDAGSASGGGDLGCFSRGVLAPEFEDVVFALKVGEMSEVVRTGFGFHVIQRTAGRAPKN